MHSTVLCSYDPDKLGVFYLAKLRKTFKIDIHMEKIFIQNRKDQKVSVLVEEVESAKGLVFIMHGLGGFKEQPHLQVIADAFLEANHTVVRFDTTNSAGESDGEMEDATATNYYEDLEDVIAWSAQQGWYQEPFILVGHSLGGLSVIRYYLAHKGQVAALLPMAPVITGKLFYEYDHPDIDFEQWKKDGIREWASKSTPDFIKRLRWRFMEDLLQFDVLKDAENIVDPILLIASDKDRSVPREQVKMLFEAIPKDNKTYFEITNSGHTYRTPEQLEQLKEAVTNWITKL